MRLDNYISEKLWLSRNRAQFLISEKLVKVNGIIEVKNSLEIKEDFKIEIIEDKKKDFVSRSAVKLDYFLDEIKLKVDSKVCLDVWASTGGFTQVLILRWAKKVLAVDVGTSQLHEKIKCLENVFSYENTDIRSFKTEEKLGLITVDVSFISLDRIIDDIIGLMSNETYVIFLFKPQFEVGHDNLKKTWIPKNQKVIDKALLGFKLLCKEKGLNIKKISESKLLGEAWNLEYLMYMKLSD